MKQIHGLDLRCLARGCGEDRLIEIERSPSSDAVHVFCQVCGHTSFFAPVHTCEECHGVGSHEETCSRFTPWAV